MMKERTTNNAKKLQKNINWHGHIKARGGTSKFPLIYEKLRIKNLQKECKSKMLFVILIKVIIARLNAIVW